MNKVTYSMKNETPLDKQAPTQAKPGLFQRIFTKLDASMKAQAEVKANKPCCGSGKDDKGGKCC